MTKIELFAQILAKKSYLCVGLDTDIHKIPSYLLTEKDPIFEFNRRIIDATEPYAVAYKPNTAFYEALGARGWESLQKTLDYIPKHCFTIADAKRGDIGNTSGLYARAFFDKATSGLDFDAVTVAPYMGKDSVTPFLGFANKWVILLALTSNEGSADFQRLSVFSDKPFDNEQVIYSQLFEQVLLTSQQWANDEQMMYVVGATQAQQLTRIRELVPNHFLLVPGVGAQGGSLAEVSTYGMNAQCGLLVNSSRGIIYASSGSDFAQQAGIEAQKLQEEMKIYLDKLL